MDKDNKQFTPAQVDEQIDWLLHLAPVSPDKALIDDLQYMYQDDERSLEKVWQRLGLQGDVPFYAERQSEILRMVQAEEQQPTGAKVLNMGRNPHMHQSDKHPVIRTLSLAAAVFVATLIVGSMLLVFTLSRQSTQTGSPGNVQHSSIQPAPNLPAGVYISSRNNVYRLDTQTHQMLWQQPFKDAVKIIPAGNVVYVLRGSSSVSGVNAVVAIDANTGKILWSHALSGQATDAVLYKNLLYVSTNTYTIEKQASANAKASGNVKTSGEVYVLKVQDGSQQMAYPAIDVAWALAAGDGVVGVSAGTGLRVYDAGSSKQLWQATVQAPSNEPIRSMQMVNGVFYAVFSTGNEQGGGQSYIAAYKDTTGQQIWKSPPFGGDALSKFTVDQNVIYFGTWSAVGEVSFKGMVYAFDVQANKQLWSQDVDGGVQHTPVVSNGVVYAEADRGSNDQAHLAALTAATGAIKWQKALKNSLFTGDFSIVNGVAYVGEYYADSNPYAPASLDALKTSDGSQVWTDTQLGQANTIVSTE